MEAVVLGHSLREIPQIPKEVVRTQVEPKPAKKKAEHRHPVADGRWHAVHIHGKCSAGRDHPKNEGRPKRFLAGWCTQLGHLRLSPRFLVGMLNEKALHGDRC